MVTRKIALAVSTSPKWDKNPFSREDDSRDGSSPGVALRFDHYWPVKVID